MHIGRVVSCLDSEHYHAHRYKSDSRCFFPNLTMIISLKIDINVHNLSDLQITPSPWRVTPVHSLALLSPIWRRRRRRVVGRVGSALSDRQRRRSPVAVCHARIRLGSDRQDAAAHRQAVRARSADPADRPAARHPSRSAAAADRRAGPADTAASISPHVTRKDTLLPVRRLKIVLAPYLRYLKSGQVIIKFCASSSFHTSLVLVINRS